MSLEQNPVIQKSLRRLKKLGLKVYIDTPSEDSLMVVVDPKSIIESVVRLVNNNITYNPHLVRYVPEKDTVVIAFWRGEKPGWVVKLESLSKM
jgi:hypothetical protein